MEEMGQGMTLFEKMRQAIGPLFDEEYKARVRTLYAAFLHDFTTFEDTAVNVIDVDAKKDMVPTPRTKKRQFELQDVEIKQEVDFPFSVEESDEAYFERVTQWLVDLHPKPVIHAPPDSDEEHILVNDDDGNLVGVIVHSMRARLAYRHAVTRAAEQ